MSQIIKAQGCVSYGVCVCVCVYVLFRHYSESQPPCSVSICCERGSYVICTRWAEVGTRALGEASTLALPEVGAAPDARQKWLWALGRKWAVKGAEWKKLGSRTGIQERDDGVWG